MGKSTPSAPAAPNPYTTAAAQTASNVGTATAQGYLNAVNQTSPYGSVSYSAGNPIAGSGTYDVSGYTKALKQYNDALKATGASASNNPAPKLADFFTAPQTQFTQNVTLSPEEKKIYDQSTNLQSQALTGSGTAIKNAQTALNTPLNFNGLPSAVSNVNPGGVQSSISTNGVPALDTNFNQARDQTTQSIIDRNAPLMQRQQDQRNNQLANQGITQGSEAWNNAQDDQARQQNDFNLAAIQAGNAEQNQLFQQNATANSQLFGQNATQADLANQAQSQQFSQGASNAALQNAARQQGIQEQAYQQETPINEFSTLFGLGGQVQGPQFTPFSAPNLQGTDISGAINKNYSDLMGQYNAKVAGNNATQSGLFGLGGSLGSAAIMASDIRLKHDIEPIGVENGHNIYEFSYVGDDRRYIGVMAHEVPEASVLMPNGYLAVDYSKIGVKFREAE